MSQREIIESIASYSSGNAPATEEEFYRLQSLLTAEKICKPTRAEVTIGKETPPIKLSSDYDSNRIASLFSNELKQLRDDPEFTGTSGQVDYLKELLAADKLVSKIPQ